MIKVSYHHKAYASARVRFLEPLLSEYLLRELQYFGPELSAMLANRIVRIFEAVCPATDHVKPGQIVWNVLHRETRGDSKNRKFVPVILTVVNEEDTERLRKGERLSKVRRDAMARMFYEAAEQGGVLSSRDACLLLHFDRSKTSKIRIEYEKEHNTLLPHTGILHDMGTTISHKSQIVRKVVLEKKDPTIVAKETNHSQYGVDRYLKDFHRVHTIYKIKPEQELIQQATGLSKSLVAEYINLIKEYTNDEK
jgi:hypothetical protein